MLCTAAKTTLLQALRTTSRPPSQAVEAGGDLDCLARSAARVSRRSIILSLIEDGSAPNVACRRIGAPLPFERLWRDSGRRAVVDLLAGRRFEFAVERTVFLTEWGALLRELDRLQEIETEQEGKHFVLRTPVIGDVGHVFRALGIAPPPNIREAEATAPADSSAGPPPRKCGAKNPARVRNRLKSKDFVLDGVKVRFGVAPRVRRTLERRLAGWRSQQLSGLPSTRSPIAGVAASSVMSPRPNCRSPPRRGPWF